MHEIGCVMEVEELTVTYESKDKLPRRPRDSSSPLRFADFVSCIAIPQYISTA